MTGACRRRMSLTLHRRRRPLARATCARSPTPTPGLVPVAKGNGYGFAVGRLARKAAAGSACDTLAVGTYDELPEVAAALRRRPAGAHPVAAVRRRARARGLPAAPGRPHRRAGSPTSPACSTREPDARFVLERLTSMRRHGMTARSCARPPPRCSRPPTATGSRASPSTCRSPAAPTSAEVAPPDERRGRRRARRRRTALGQPPHRRRARLAAHVATPTSSVRPRIGTALWLGDRGALRSPRPCSTSTRSSAATCSATAAGRAPEGRPHPRRQPAAPPTASGSRRPPATAPCAPAPRPWPAAASTRSASCARRSRSTASTRLFAEPPHMQASMLFLPHGPRVPAVGDEVDVRVRFTTTTVRPGRRQLTVAALPQRPAPAGRAGRGSRRLGSPWPPLPHRGRRRTRAGGCRAPRSPTR